MADGGTDIAADILVDRGEQLSVMEPLILSEGSKRREGLFPEKSV